MSVSPSAFLSAKSLEFCSYMSSICPEKSDWQSTLLRLGRMEGLAGYSTHRRGYSCTVLAMP